MKPTFKKTKIVATLGPASTDQKTLRAMIKSGLNIARLNFSHGDHAEHRERLENFRAAGESLDTRVAVLQDLSGPKIRTGDFVDGSVKLRSGQQFILSTKKVPGDSSITYVNYPKLPAEVDVGGTIRLDDGKIELTVTKTTKHQVITKVRNGGTIKSRRGVNLPGAHLSVSSITSKDKADLQFGIKHKVDFVALSFVRSAADIKQLRRMLDKAKSKAMIVAKIETQEAVDDFESILAETDAIMVARGDLAIEIGPERVPAVQKEIIAMCNQAGKPVITATQMLESMISSPVPTRAEISDVANAIIDGTDAIMLSGETAIGEYPRETITVMSRIAHETEDEFVHPIPDDLWKTNIQTAISTAVVQIANQVSARYIVSLTESGSSAREIARFHADQTILAISPHYSTCNQLMLSYGCLPIHTNSTKPSDVTKNLIKYLRTEKMAKPGDRFVVSSGMHRKQGSTNSLSVITIEK